MNAWWRIVLDIGGARLVFDMMGWIGDAILFRGSSRYRRGFFGGTPRFGFAGVVGNVVAVHCGCCCVLLGASFRLLGFKGVL